MPLEPKLPRRKSSTAVAVVPTLSDRHEQFAQQYLLDLNPGGAYRRVYGAKVTAAAARVAGWRLLRMPEVAGRVSELKAERAARLGLEQDRVLRQLMDIVECDPGLVFDAHGSLMHLASMDDRTRNALASFKVRRVRSDDGISEEVVEIKFWDKVDAIRTAMQHMGILNDSTVAGTPPGIVPPLTEADVKDRLEQMGEIMEIAKWRMDGAHALGLTVAESKDSHFAGQCLEAGMKAFDVVRRRLNAQSDG